MRISFNTLGCRLNQSETAVISRTFEQKGYRVVEFSEPADIVVINTCTVTEGGDTDTRRLVQKINRLNPAARIALIGCQAQIQKDKLLALQNVRWVVGNARKMDLVWILEHESPGVIAPPIPRETFTIPTAGIDPHHTRAIIKIQDGCDFFCSFCEIPYARGRARSRQFEDILIEARALAAAGHKELVITGINVGTYHEGNRSFLDVIEALEQIEGVERIRISSIEPTTVSMDLIRKMSRESKLCRYLHIPIQSASNTILSLMKRKYTFEEFRDFVNETHALIPEICIGTDVIVGFPGETDELFQETEERLKNLPVDYFHVFSYSKRTLAQSRNFKNVVPAQNIQKRSEILRNLSQRKRRLFYESLLGTKQKILIEHKEKEYWPGLTDNYVRVAIFSDRALQNQFIEVKLEEIEGQNVSASIAS